MKWRELTYKTRLKVLPFLFVLGFLLIYWLALDKTIVLSGELSVLENKVELLSDAPLQIEILKKRLEHLENSIGNYNEDISQERIFSELSDYCKENGLSILEFPDSHEFNSNGQVVNTFQVEIEGSFHSLLKLVHRLEQEIFLGKMAGVKFQLKSHRRSREEYLSVKIFLQTIN
ncbi:MAG: hypothetical protein COC06_09510 [Bacteroidales bacterium]|nr:MAG: hypothetical protein COC06_09510 [Bacteroidales bacterium]